jgi:hypothetical protein
MLVDISRRPARLIMEECPTVIVVRTMKIQGRVDGLLHQERDREQERRNAHTGTWRQRFPTVQPKVTLPSGEVEYIETLIDPASYRETYAISGFVDQVTKVRGRWRINFIIDEVKPGTRLLTLLDETNSVMLFTVQLSAEVVSPRGALFNITTPLRRYINRQAVDGNTVSPGLWGAILDEDF